MTNLLVPSKRWLNPTTLSSNLIFIVTVTLLVAIAGWLMKTGILPSLTETALSQHYSLHAFIPRPIWMRMAVVLTIILPTVVLLTCWRWLAVRRVFMLYIGVIVVQILTESLFHKWNIPRGINWIIGFIYTSHRIWQLWCYQQYIRSQQELVKFRRQNMVLAVFVICIIFWTLNWLNLSIEMLVRAANV
jgi:hypothetical protein